MNNQNPSAPKPAPQTSSPAQPTAAQPQGAAKPLIPTPTAAATPKAATPAAPTSAAAKPAMPAAPAPTAAKPATPAVPTSAAAKPATPTPLAPQPAKPATAPTVAKPATPAAPAPTAAKPATPAAPTSAAAKPATPTPPAPASATASAPAAASATEPSGAMVDKVKAAVKMAVVKGDFDIPVLPHVAAEVMKLMNDPKLGIPEMEKVVKQDQGIAARVVKMANSTMFRGVQEITSLSQAMSRIGLKNVKDIVVSLGLQSQTFKIAGFEDTLSLVWNHSIACATIAQALATNLSADKELAFLSGLMHDIGKPVLIQILSKLENAERLVAMGEARKAFKKFDEKAYRLPGLRETIVPQAFHEFHTVVGSAVAARWNLPETVVQVVKHHHEPEKCDEKAKKLCHVIHLSNEICHHMGYGHIQQNRDIENSNSVKALDLQSTEMKELLEDITPKVEAALSSF